MSVNHLISFFIASVNNAGKVGKSSVTFAHSKLIEGVCKVMLEEGFIKGFNVITHENNTKSVSVELAYYKGSHVIKEFQVVSKPGLRVYKAIDAVKQFYDGLGFYILSTNKGIMTDKSAKKLNVGGEILCKIF